MSRKELEMVLLIDFASGRNEKPDTIRKYISRHKEEFEGHTSFSGAKMEIDEHAYELLDKIYPLPKPIEIIEDNESRRKLVQAQDLIIQMQQKMMDMQEKVALAESTRALLEDKEHQLAELQAEKKELKEQIASREQKLEEERIKNESLSSELGRYHKSIFGFYKKD